MHTITLNSPQENRPRRGFPSGANFLVTDANGSPLHETGNTDQPFILAGVSKLYTTAMVIREFDRGALSPDTKASHVLPHKMLDGLCVVRGKDWSNDVTIGHLLSHRSGITDYFSHPRRGAMSLLRQTGDRDRAWSLEQALELARHYPGRFRPGTPNRVHYSDTNYQILGAILKSTTGLSFAQLFSIRISGPLALKRTYVFTEETAEKYYELAPLRWANKEMNAPLSLASFGADGAVVSTPSEVITFLRALWSGKLTNESWIPRLWSETLPLGPSWAMGLGAMTYGSRQDPAPLVGHTGFTGAAAFVDPTRRLFAAGSLNSIGYLGQPAKKLARLMKSVAL
jgi:D-alanyl-D-alanine carboxypeptidase